MNHAAANLVRGYAAGELDLLAVLETAIARHPRVLKNGLPNLAFFRAANAALSQPEDEAEGVGFSQVEFWIALARQLRLVEDRHGRLEVTGAADAFFADEPATRRDRLREAWIDAHEFNEFTVTHSLELPGLRKERTVDVGSDVPGAGAMMDARRKLVQLAATVDSELSLAEFIRRAHALDANLFIDHDDDGSWRNVFYRGIRERGAREDIERQGNWEHVEGAVIGLMCDLPLSKLGWIEFDARTQTLRPAPDEHETPAFEIIVQPNFEIVALGDRPDAATLWKLARFTTPQPEGRVRKYVLERKPFADALGRGADAAELTSLLGELSRSPIPQNVQFSLQDWGALSERIKIWPDALFVEREGVEDLARLLSPGALDALSLEALPEGHYAGVAPGLGELKEAVQPRRNVLDYSRRLPPVIEPGAGAALRAPREDLHLRARQLLALVSRSTSTDTYELDEATVRESAAVIGPDVLMARLKEGLSRPLSAPVALALRTWCGEFAPAQTIRAELLLADNPDQADLIEELDSVQPWISKRLARGVYLLRAGGTERVRQALKQIGLDTTQEQE